MKVVHIVRQFSPSVGGLESMVLNLAETQRKRFGTEAGVVSLNTVFGRKGRLAAHDMVGTVPVTRIPWVGSQRYPLAPAILKPIWDADIVHVHAVDFFFDFLALTAPLHGRKLVACTHGGFFHTPNQAGLKKLWFRSITRASCLPYKRIIACSQSDAEIFREIAGQKVTLVENGIDQTRLQNAASGGQNRNIIYFGRWAEHKKITAIFPLLHALRRQHPGWRLLIAGREWNQTLGELQQAAVQAEVADAVAFSMDPSDSQLRELIGQASYFACLSSYEGFGLAAVEAMSAGLFPLLSDIAPFERLKSETGLGIIIRSEAVEANAAAIEASVLQDPTMYNKRRNALMESVRCYDWETVAAQYETIYQEVLMQPAGQEHLQVRQ